MVLSSYRLKFKEYKSLYVKNVQLPYFAHLDWLSQATCITQFVLRKTDLNIKFKPENPSRASAGAVPIAKLIQILFFSIS